MRITGASRTDAGVHALGQVASFASATRLAPRRAQEGAQRRPRRRTCPCSPATRAPRASTRGFDAHGQALLLPDPQPHRAEPARARPLAPRPRAARRRGHARGRAGTCSASTTSARFETEATLRYRELEEKGRSTEDASVRRISDGPRSRDSVPRGTLVVLDVAGTGFLYNMVRSLVGTLVQVGRGKRPPERRRRHRRVAPARASRTDRAARGALPRAGVLRRGGELRAAASSARYLRQESSDRKSFVRLRASSTDREVSS